MTESNEQRHDTEALKVEVLGVSPAVSEGKPVLIVATRPEDGQSWASSDWMLTPEVAKRLADDIYKLFRMSPDLQAVAALPEPRYLDRVMAEGVTVEEADGAKFSAKRKPRQKKKGEG